MGRPNRRILGLTHVSESMCEHLITLYNQSIDGRRGNCSMQSVAHYACKSIIKQLLLLFKDEKCIDILKCKTTIGQLKIIIIEIKHLSQCPGQDRQQQPTVTHSINTKHKKNKINKTVHRGMGRYQYRKTFREAQRGQ